jgi:peptidyl-prolyl cis-trans isomerase C
MIRSLLALMVVVLFGCTPKDVVAEVGGRRVTVADVRQSMRVASVDAGAALEMLVERERLAAWAIQQKLDAKPEVQLQLKAAQREILANAALEDAKIADESALRAAYLDGGMRQVRQLEVAQIFIAGVDADSQNRALTVSARLAGGEAFDDVAKALSEDADSAARAGRIGLVKEGTVAPELFEAAAALPAGGTSKAIRTAYGFHILKALSAVTKESVPFEEAKGGLVTAARRQAREDISKKAQSVAVKRFEEALKQVEGAQP